MNRLRLPLCVMLFIAVLAIAGCSRQAEVELTEPATVTPVKGATDLSQIVLTDVAFKNLGIQTQAVREEEVATQVAGVPKRRLVIPTSALIFNSQGIPFAYTSPAPKTYVRAPIVVDEYRGADVLLLSGPKVGTQVVTVGDPELLGIEYGVGEE